MFFHAAPRVPSRASAPAIGLGLLLAACGGPADDRAEPVDAPAPAGTGVIHLDPRLEGGLSPTRAILDDERVVHEWRFDAGPEELGPWRVAHGAADEGSHAGAITLVSEADAATPPALVLVDPPDPSAYDVVEVDVHGPRRSAPLVDCIAGEPDSRPIAAVESYGVAGESLQTLEFVLGGVEGPLDLLALQLKSMRTASLEFAAVRFVRRGFEPGYAPLDPAGVESGGGGLTGIERDLWRSWPVPLADPLGCDVELPPGAQLDLGVLVPLGAPEGARELVVTLVDPSGERPPEVVVTHDFDEPGGGKRAWRRLGADLSAHAGRRVRLEFLVTSDVLDPDGRAVVLLGAPIVVGSEASAKRPNIVLVTLDTTRFDALGSSLAELPSHPARSLVHTPFLDSLAERSLVFTDAWSAANSTQPSHASILTGLAVQDHALEDNFGVLDPSITTLAELLRDHGYYTAASVSLEAVSVTAGFGQGFDRFAHPSHRDYLDGRGRTSVAQRWIEEWSTGAERPFFIWLHLFDPHTPYVMAPEAIEAFARASGVPQPPPRVEPPTLFEPEEYPGSLRFLRGINNKALPDYLYRAEVFYADGLLADLHRTLAAAGLGDSTVTAITADHGEALGENQVYYNHAGLTDELVHVPLILHVPGVAPGRVGARVSSRDLVPTFVDLVGLDDVPPTRNLLEIAEGGGDPERVVWFEHAHGYQVGCRDAQYHFITTLRPGFAPGLRAEVVDGREVLRTVVVPPGTSFLYDWRTDPELEHDLAAERPAVVAEYLERLEAYRASARPFTRAARAMSEDEERKLEALGYAGD